MLPPRPTTFRVWLTLVALFAAEAGFTTALGAALLDDRAITIHSRNDVPERRRALIDYLWGPEGFPVRRFPDQVITNIPSPVRALGGLRRVDELRMNLAPGLEALAFHFIPEKPNRELVVVHHGHACTLDDDPSQENVGYGLQRTIAALLREGYGVLGVFMPHMRPGDCTGQHDEMFRSGGRPMRYFLEPTAISLNHVKQGGREFGFPRYRTFHMAGLSGGGWTTTVYAAIDPTIRCSFPVAGTAPLHLRSGGSIGDREQFEPSFYGIAGYQDLYLLGAQGKGRRQVQILLRRDDCCFGEAQHDARAAGAPYAEAMHSYEARVRGVLKGLGPGEFRLEIDETAPSHMISHHAIEVMLAELRRP